MSSEKLSHVDSSGKSSMVNVADKAVTQRVAIAKGEVHMLPATLDLVRSNALKKGDVLGVARVAAIQAAKRTSELIPFCHPLGLENCKITIVIGGVDGDQAVIDCTCRVHHKTGVEMEALTGASVAALTIYDMCKALSHDIVIGETRLMSKTGGKQDFHHDE